jgi:hypothetical protein
VSERGPLTAGRSGGLTSGPFAAPVPATRPHVDEGRTAPKDG